MTNFSGDKSRMSHQHFVSLFSNFKILKFLKTKKENWKNVLPFLVLTLTYSWDTVMVWVFGSVISCFILYFISSCVMFYFVLPVFVFFPALCPTKNTSTNFDFVGAHFCYVWVFVNPKCRRHSLQAEKIYFHGDVEVVGRCEVQIGRDVQASGSLWFGHTCNQELTNYTYDLITVWTSAPYQLYGQMSPW